MRFVSFAVVAALVVAMVVPSLPATAQSIAEARAQRRELQARLDAAADELAALASRQARLEEEAADLQQRLSRLEAELQATDERVDVRVRALYKRGSADAIVSLLAGEDPDDAIERATFVRQLVAGDRRDAERARVARTKTEVVAGRLEQARSELEASRVRQQQVTQALEEDLTAAQRLEQRLEREERERREAEERRRAAARPRSAPSGSSGGGRVVQSGPMACPVARPHSFTDTWGAPRSGGRRHKGTDILAPYGQTVVAIVSGVWDVRSYGRSAGHWGILRGHDGNQYYYMHLQSHVVGDGARVAAGQQVATNGDTGNARGTPHVHFELHPGGGGAINPYPTLRRVCG